jgi:hypothetical protein
MPRYKVKRTDNEIDQQLNLANEWEEHGGSAVSGMNFEQGVKYGIDWILGDMEDLPIKDGPEQEDEEEEEEE